MRSIALRSSSSLSKDDRGRLDPARRARRRRRSGPLTITSSTAGSREQLLERAEPDRVARGSGPRAPRGPPRRAVPPPRATRRGTSAARSAAAARRRRPRPRGAARPASTRRDAASSSTWRSRASTPHRCGSRVSFAGEALRGDQPQRLGPGQPQRRGRASPPGPGPSAPGPRASSGTPRRRRRCGPAPAHSVRW